MSPTSHFKLNTGASIPALGLGMPAPPLLSPPPLLILRRKPAITTRLTNPRNLAVRTRRSRKSRQPRDQCRLPPHRYSILLPERRRSRTGHQSRSRKRKSQAGGSLRHDETMVHISLSRRGGAGSEFEESGTGLSGFVPDALAAGDES